VAGEEHRRGAGTGSGYPAAHPGAGGGEGPAWWRLRPWSGVLTGIAAVLLLSIGFLAGDAVGHGGASSPATAATTPSATATATPTSGVTQPATSPGTGSSPSTGATSVAGTASPTSTPIPAAPAAPPSFEAFSSTNCEVAAAPDYECGTVEVAQFTGGGSVSQYTAQVTFANSAVQIAATTDGKPAAAVFAQANTGGAFVVTMGDLTFPGPGPYAYKVTVTNTSNGDTATWQGSMPVGESAGSTVSPAPTSS